MLNLMLAFATSTAYGLGGAFAGAALETLPSSRATQVAIAVQGDETSLTITAQAGEDVTGVGYLWPAPGFVQGTEQAIEPEALDALEAFTRPRVEQLECEELIDTVRYRTPPGCASYEVSLVEPDDRGEDAVDDVPLDVDYGGNEVEVEVLTPAEVDEWLEDRGLWLSQPVEDGLEPLLSAGHPVIAVFFDGFLARGEWLPPVRFKVATGDVQLPLAGYAAAASTNHDLHVFTLHDSVTTDSRVTNLSADEILDDCQLPDDVEPADWFDAEAERFVGRAEAPWVSVWRTPAAQCAPCTTDPLTLAHTADLGIPGADLAEYRAGRIFVRLAPQQLGTDPVISFDDAAADGGLRWIAPQAGVGFLFPPCGEAPNPLDVCPTVQTEDTRGCAAVVPPWTVAPWALVVLVLLRRRRWLPAAVALGLCTVSADALAVRGDDGFKDNRPPWEVQVSTGLVGTPRVRLERTAQAAPRLSSPMFGLQGRYAAFHLRDGLNVGVVAGVRGWRGTLQIADGPEVGFGFVEPSLGLDVRHGLLQSGGITPFVRYGARIAVPVLDANTAPPQVAVGTMLQVGGGIWIGSDDRTKRLWPIVELRGTVLPRTDGYVTRYHSSLDLPWYTFFPGGANLELLVGLGFR